MSCHCAQEIHTNCERIKNLRSHREKHCPADSILHVYLGETTAGHASSAGGMVQLILLPPSQDQESTILILASKLKTWQ